MHSEKFPQGCKGNENSLFYVRNIKRPAIKNICFTLKNVVVIAELGFYNNGQ